MTNDQRRLLQTILEDDENRVTTIEYPASTGASNFGCLKVCYLIDVAGENRHFVDWYGEDGEVLATREITTDRHPSVDPMGPETTHGGLVGQQPY